MPMREEMIIRIELSVYMAFNMVMTFLDKTPKAWLAHEKIYKLDLSKIMFPLCEKQCQGHEKTRHKLGENIFEKHI